MDVSMLWYMFAKIINFSLKDNIEGGNDTLYF